METRPLGATGQESTALTLGAIALDSVEQQQANRLVENALDSGVNHVDVAPSYGDAELKLGPKLREHREEFFLGCKTLERDRGGAREKLAATRTRLGVDSVDLYQFHAVVEQEDLDRITEDGGAYEAVAAAREDGAVDHVGVTGHGDPAVLRDAVRDLDLDTVMFPYNAALAASGTYDPVLDAAADHDVGTIGIKAFARCPWDRPEGERPYATWYEPVDTPSEVRDRLRFAASAVDTVASGGDPQLLPMMLHAAETYEPLAEDEREAAVAAARGRERPAHLS